MRPNVLIYSSICPRCLLRLSRLDFGVRRQALSQVSIASQQRPVKSGTARRDYFSENSILDGPGSLIRIAATKRGNKERRYEDTTEAIAAVRNSPQPRTPPPLLSSASSVDTRLLNRPGNQGQNPKLVLNILDPPIPHDASARLSILSTLLPRSSTRRLFAICLSLSKPRLSALIVLTTAAAYSLYPVPSVLLPSTTASPSLSTLTLLFLTSGTALCCASANTLNMLLEPEYDAKMSRTRNRPLVRKLISKRGALVFAGIAGLTGIGGLFYGVNPTVAFLGGLNIFLYAGVYTPMKRISVINTWIGALVGGIPPLMGWAAAAGQSATGSGGWQELLLSEGSSGGWLLAGLLFAWQFPHFNALSWSIRDEYKNAGYRMLCWTNPKRNGRVAFRYSLLLFPVCIGLTYVGVTDQGFLVTSSIANAWMVREAWKFLQKEGHKGSAKGLFWASVWHLPLIMVLAMAHKKGLWEGMWRSVTGEDLIDELWVTDDADPEFEEKALSRKLEDVTSPSTTRKQERVPV